MEKIKILIAAGLYPPDIGGPATYAQMLEEELPKAGFEVTVVPFGSVRHLPKVFRHIAFAWKLFREARKSDVVYALDPISVGIPAWFVSFVTRKSFVIRLGGDYAWEQGRLRFGVEKTLDAYTADGPTGRPLPVRILAFLQSFVVKRAVRVVAPSAYLERIITSWGVPFERISVIHSALFPLPVSESRDALRKKLSYNGTVLISAGRLTPWKGFSELLNVVVRLRENGEAVTLVIAGDGPLEIELKEKAKKLHIEDRVRFVGKLTKEALGAAVKASDMFVYNTSYEGLPHQLLEVMDLGVPVISTNIGGVRAVLTDGVDSVLVDPNDIDGFVSAVTRVQNNAQLKNRIVQNARVKTKSFSRDVVMDELTTLLHTV